MSNNSLEPVGFVFPAFPVLHQTFVLWEVLALRRRGIPIVLYSLKRPSTALQQPEALSLAAETRYVPFVLSPAVVAANWRVFRRGPRRYVGTYFRMIREWWRDRNAGQEWKKSRASAAAPERQYTVREWVQGRFNRNAGLFLLKSLWLIPSAAYLGEELQRRGIRRLHAHWASYSATVALAVHWLYDLPFSFTAHAYDIYVVPTLLKVKVEEAEQVITCAHVNAGFLASRAPDAPPERIIVNYHGVDLQRFRLRTGAPHNDLPCILTCGRLEPYKGHHILLQACAALSRPVRCVVVGEGPQEARLKALAAKLGIAARVEFTGPLPQAELVQRYADADLFVLASVILERSGKRDVIPNVLVEAMAMGVPVVATSVSGIAELVTDGVSGRLVAPNDPGALAAILDELLADSSQRLRLIRGAEEKVRSSFDREKNIEALAEMLRSAVREGRGRAAEPWSREGRDMLCGAVSG